MPDTNETLSLGSNPNEQGSMSGGLNDLTAPLICQNTTTQIGGDSNRENSEDFAPVELPPGYLFDGKIAAGGMGVVYRAWQKSLNRAVALKMILMRGAATSEMKQRFEVEAQALGRLSHPGIIQVYDHGEYHGNPFIVMELCTGGNLADLLVRRQVAPQKAALLAASLAESMEMAHRAGIVHRDLKPSNILIKEKVESIDTLLPGQMRIADFGLAKQLDSKDAGLTRADQLVGTANYMAPEQLRSANKAGPAADIYALGTILYELLTGCVPFQAPTFMAVMRLLEKEDPLPVSRLAYNCPTDLETICLKCLAKNPTKRYASAADLAADLRRFLAGEPIMARRPGLAESVWRWARNRPGVATLALLAALSPLAGVIYIQWLANELVRHTALESVAQQADLLLHANDEYSDIVKKVRDLGYQITHDPIPEKNKIPLSIPATFIHDIGHRLERSPTSDIDVRLYSEYPFPWRAKEGGARDTFEREALKQLEAHPEQHIHSFEVKDGKKVLRYAIARVLKDSCVDCHNTRADSPKKNWKVGDVRGVLEITRPLMRDENEVRQRVKGPLWAVTLLSCGLIFGAITAVVASRNRGRRNTREHLPGDASEKETPNFRIEA
jgi:hypothetical protein